eukprot:TRINITY_DN38030_c0_g1_i1.p1 TRINITY_DN38030_c0_g1~~TRINITY_DN38030_c0_g1_i1.p1  ORF type:complete len:558 (+),score=50.10 TRINITY_DN38030_c0_g1_i1:85-1674(+)
MAFANHGFSNFASCFCVLVFLLLIKRWRRLTRHRQGARFTVEPLLVSEQRSAELPGWKGARPKPFATTVAVGLIVRYAIQRPIDVTSQAWSMLAIFVATITAIVLAPMQPPAVAICMLVVGVVTDTFTFQQGVAAFSDEVIWMILFASFFARAFSKTGFGTRIAFNVVRIAGGTTLGLAYSLNACECLVAVCMPSSAARSSGVFFPIVISISKASGSDPDQGTHRKMGSFLVQNMFQATANSSCLWMTGCSLNFLMLRLASQLGYTLPTPFRTWFVVTCVPTLVSMTIIPLVVYVLLPPEVKITPEAPKAARTKLERMGPMSRDEHIMLFVMVLMVFMWATAASTGIAPVTTAAVGVSLLLVLGPLSWEDCAAERGVWGTFIWFSVLVGMGGLLNEFGVVAWISREISRAISEAGLSTWPAFALLVCSYAAAHYLFASQVAHVGALYQPFCSMMVATGTPPLAAVMSLAMVSNFFSTLTPYASAQSPVFFSARYASQAEWYLLGAVCNLVNMLIFGTVGVFWWKTIGWI